jgi:hypothetical protein
VRWDLELCELSSPFSPHRFSTLIGMSFPELGVLGVDSGRYIFTNCLPKLTQRHILSISPRNCREHQKIVAIKQKNSRSRSFKKTVVQDHSKVLKKQNRKSLETVKEIQAYLEVDRGRRYYPSYSSYSIFVPCYWLFDAVVIKDC